MIPSPRWAIDLCADQAETPELARSGRPPKNPLDNGSGR
jgi:hypothetical protein